MYIENNDIRTLRDRAPEGCACGRSARPLSAHGGKHPTATGGDCSNYFITLGAPLAAVYSPMQVWKDLYSEAQALAHGTLFAELDKPFVARGRKCK